MMEISKIVLVIALTLAISSVFSVRAQQISTPCTSSMISTFTPCLNFITRSNGDGSSSATTGCCSSLRSLMSTSMDCACLIITANVPLPLNINRTLALSLPRVCNVGSVPMQCKAAGTPLPAPGPGSFLLGPPPSASFPLSPPASTAAGTAPATEPGTMLAPESPSDKPLAPATNPGIRPLTQPSSPGMAYATSPPLALVLLVSMIIYKCFW